MGAGEGMTYIPDPIPPHKFMYDSEDLYCDLCTEDFEAVCHQGNPPRYTHAEYRAIVKQRMVFDRAQA